MSKSDAGKGDNPRSCFSKQFKDNYDQIEGFTYKPSWQKRDEEKVKRKARKRRKAAAWLNSTEFEGVIIHSPDGWKDKIDFLENEITKKEFVWKLARSKATIPDNLDLTGA